MSLPNNLTLEMVIEAVENDDNLGFCLQCGAERGQCEPDAREYKCEECGASKVYGAEEILIMYG
jgi:hypothetical protein